VEGCSGRSSREYPVFEEKRSNQSQNIMSFFCQKSLLAASSVIFQHLILQFALCFSLGRRVPANRGVAADWPKKGRK
jgi:hypothetical protein